MRAGRVLVAACWLLAACGSGGPAAQQSSGGGSGTSVAADDGRVDCAIDASAEMLHVCTIERAQSAAGPVFTLRDPSGGFRRLRNDSHGGIVAADGAAPARVSALGGDRIEVEIGGARFRLNRGQLR